MPTSLLSGVTASGERLPWASGLRSVAQNHRPADCFGGQLGDVIFTAPRLLTYVARKVVITGPAPRLEVTPRTFEQDGTAFELPEATVRRVWTLAHRLLATLTPAGFELDRPSIALERLSYDASLETLRQRIALFRSAGGPLSRLGHRLDEQWASAAGALRGRWLRSAFALGSLIPGRLAASLAILNNRARARSVRDRLPEGGELLGEPHTDGRLFTFLGSERDVVRTELWTGTQWRELPLSSDSLVIIPGRLARRVGLEPTLHRIVHTGERSAGALNATLVIGVNGAG